jgi:hypothetical protein
MQFFIICPGYLQYKHTVVLVEFDCFKDQGFWHIVHVDEGAAGMTELTCSLWCNLDLIPSEQAMLWPVMLKGWTLWRLFGKGLNIKHDPWVGVNPSPVLATVCASVLWFWETRVAFLIQPAFILCPSCVSVNRGFNQRGINKKMIFPLEVRG